MAALDVTAVVVGVVVALLLALALRRLVLRRRGGTIDANLRLGSMVGRGWALGLGRYAGDELHWYRVFSLAPRPRRVLTRRGLVIVGRRAPTRPEGMALLPGAIVLELAGGGRTIEIAMTDAALTGFLAWLESAPPGVGGPPR